MEKEIYYIVEKIKKTPTILFVVQDVELLVGDDVSEAEELGAVVIAIRTFDIKKQVFHT